MQLEKNQISSKLDIVILSLIVLQVISVSISIALSSIAFGAWIILWGFQAVVYRRDAFKGSIWREIKPVALFMAFYAIFEILSRVFAIYPEGALLGVKRVLIFLIFFAVIYKVPDKKTLHFIIFVLVCMTSFISIYELIKFAILAPEAIPQKGGFSETRIDYLLYPLSGAEIKLMVLMSIFPLFFIKERFFVELKYLILLSIPIVVSMYLTQSRNVFLSFIICLIIFGIIKSPKYLLIGAAAAVLVFFLLPVEFTERYTSIFSTSHGSNAGRLVMWETGWRMFLDHPFTGIGDNKIMDYYATYRDSMTEWEHSHLHSNIFMVLATTGIFGFLSFLGLFLTIFIKQIKFYKQVTNETDKALIMGSILMFIAFNISGIFEWSFGDHEVITVFFFLVSVPFVIFKLMPKKVNTN